MANPIRIDDLSEIERRVVLPVVRSLLRDDELEHVSLTFNEPEGSWPFPAEAGSVWLTVVAVGEDFHHMLVLPTAVREPAEQDDPDDADEAYGPLDDDADGMADNLYSQLWDWIVETRFSWGEPRDGAYVIPPPDTRPTAGLAPGGNEV